MTAGSPNYNWMDFVAACKKGLAEVFVFKGAMITAEQDFKLKTMEDVVAFIASGGCENPKFINCKDWENNPNKSIPVKVDAYNFSAGLTFGYLAFLKPNQKWLVKSFKEEPKGDPRNLVLAEALKGLLKGAENE